MPVRTNEGRTSLPRVGNRWKMPARGATASLDVSEAHRLMACRTSAIRTPCCSRSLGPSRAAQAQAGPQAPRPPGPRAGFFRPSTGTSRESRRGSWLAAGFKPARGPGEYGTRRGCEVHLQGIQPQEALRAAARQGAEINTTRRATTQSSTSTAAPAEGLLPNKPVAHGRVCEARARLFSLALMKP